MFQLNFEAYAQGFLGHSTDSHFLKQIFTEHINARYNSWRGQRYSSKRNSPTALFSRSLRSSGGGGGWKINN